VDVHEEAAKDADYRLRVMRVEKWEGAARANHAGLDCADAKRDGARLAGPIKRVIRNVDCGGRDALPGIFRRSGEVADRTRRLVGLGIDTLKH